MRSLMVSTVAKFPSSSTTGSSSMISGSGTAIRATDLWETLRGRSALAGPARPARPKRWTLPITALRVTPPSTRAIWLAERPSAHSDFSCSTRSSVQPIGFLLPYLQHIVSEGCLGTRIVAPLLSLVHRIRITNKKALHQRPCYVQQGLFVRAHRFSLTRSGQKADKPRFPFFELCGV